MFTLLKTDGRARRGRYQTPHGTVETPVFMNVGTQAAIKGGLAAEDLAAIGCQVELSNTYHLHLRPGESIVRAAGGLHGFMQWSGPILTDSGGFQVYSLANRKQITEAGVPFRSHIDGRAVFMGPEESMQIQAALGADVAMAFDECVENPAPYDYVARSCARTTRWLHRCIEARARLAEDGALANPGQVLWGINQGGTHEALRVAHMQEIAACNLPGYAVGGLAVGEPAEEMYRILDTVTPWMPKDKPRYLMGVGTPGNLLEAVSRGIDFFDCVLPARNARHGHLYTHDGRINLNNKQFAADFSPPDPQCDCPVCTRHTRAYLRHLLRAGEVLGLRLCVIHNLYFYNRFMSDIRTAIEDMRFDAFRRDWADRLDQRGTAE